MNSLVSTQDNGVFGLRPMAATAYSDQEAVAQWLGVHAMSSEETLRAYRRNVSYWLYFLEQAHGYRPDLLRSATPADAQRFVQLLQLGGGTRPDGTAATAASPNHFGVRRNPFATPKSNRSLAQVIFALSSLYRHHSQKTTADAQALLGFNPFAHLSAAVIKPNTKTDRLFELREYELLLEAADERLAQACDDTERTRAWRMRWIAVALFNLWLRISELAALRMGDIGLDRGVWFANVLGKGKKYRRVELTQEALQTLGDYRQALGWSRFPMPTETWPTVVRLDTQRPDQVIPLKAEWIRAELRVLAHYAADRLAERHDVVHDPVHARSHHRLLHMSPHWFRHAGASDALNAGFKLQDTAERLGHANPSTTHNMYSHTDYRRRAAELDAIVRSRADRER
jgi:integrase